MLPWLWLPVIACDQVWWYICVVPRTPYANIFLEYPAIESRLLMGAMTAKYRPDGFLYYQTSLWQAKEPIRKGPFTNWDPRSYRDAHGDGSWLCMREGGLPVPTIRLENYRDGLEDYAYARILEEAIRIKERKGESLTQTERQWLVRSPGGAGGAEGFGRLADRVFARPGATLHVAGAAGCVN